MPNMFKGEAITCLVNPLVGRELELVPAEQKKEVMVIGGGPAGLYAAYICALRGHAVTLYEEKGLLGGNMRLAAYPPGKGCINGMLCSYIENCRAQGVKLEVNTPATLETVKEKKPDAVIIATGSRPLVLPIPGIEKAVHAADILDGKVKPGKRVLVVGGGMVGCETADFLGELGHEVSVIELRDELGADVIPEHKKFLIKALKEYRIQGITGAKVTDFHDDGVSYVLEDGTMGRIEHMDTVVLAMGYRSHDELSDKIQDLVKEVYVIGDAVRARRALDATREALEVAMAV